MEEGMGFDYRVLYTLVPGLAAIGNAIGPVLIWYLHESQFNPSYGASNWLYYISWWVMWIGGIVAYPPAALMWIPAYFSQRIALIYGMTWLWGMGIGALVFIYTWTTLLCSIINWPTEKNIQTTFLLYTVNAMLFGGALMQSAGEAVAWYVGSPHCEMDENGNCVDEEEWDI